MTQKLQMIKLDFHYVWNLSSKTQIFELQKYYFVQALVNICPYFLL